MDESTAAGLPRSLICELGDNDEAGPKLFLDGSQYVNPQRSDCCFAFFVGPLPKAPPAKAPAAGQKKERKEKPRPLETHKLIWEPLEIQLACGMKFCYKLPYLVDNPQHEDVVDQAVLYRLPTPLDDAKLLKAVREMTCSTVGFATK